MKGSDPGDAVLAKTDGPYKGGRRRYQSGGARRPQRYVRLSASFATSMIQVSKARRRNAALATDSVTVGGERARLDYSSAEACGARQPARKARGATQSDEFGHGVQGSTQPDEFGHGVQSSIVHSKQLAARRRTRELMHRLTALTLPPRAWRHFDLYDLRNENRIARISRRSVRARSAARGHRFQRNAGKAAASSEAGDSQAFTFRCGLSETRVKRAVPVSCEVRAVLALQCSREPAVGSHLPRGRWLHGGP